MSLLAGFDMVVEIASSALLDLIKSRMIIGGTRANPPFEITVPLSGDDMSGGAHLIVHDLLLDLKSDDTVTFTFKFSNSSVISPSPVLTISALDGKFIVTAPLGLVLSNQTQLTVPTINLAAASVKLEFTQAAKGKLADGLAGTGTSVAQFTSLAQSQITTFVQTIGAQPLGNGYSVMAGGNGAISPLRFERLELHCIVGSATNQAIGLFGILLLANHSKGNATGKTAPALTSGHDMCVSIAPSAFRSLLFCPSVAGSLGVAVESLPTPCGLAPFGVSTQGVVITKIADTFTSGHVNVNGEFTKSGFCYDATGTFHGEITISASGTTLTPNLSMDEPDVDVSIDWYCGPAGGIAIGLTALINVAITNAIFEAIATDLAQGAVDGALGNSLPSQDLAGIQDVTFDQVSITTEGLQINGNTIIPMPTPQVPGLTLIGSVTTSNTSTLSTGTYVAILPLCPEKEFPYTEFAQQQTALYQAVPTLLGLPLKLKWWLLASDGVTKVLFQKRSGTVSFNTQTIYSLPLPSGTYVNQEVHIGYEKFGDFLQLTNVPTEGNYRFGLYAKATDPLGNTVEILVPGFPVVFEGNAVQIGGGYQEYAAKCLAAFGQLLDKFSEHTDVTFTPWVPVDYPAPEELLNHMLTLMASQHPKAHEALLQTKLAHGSSFYRAVFSAAAQKVGLERLKKTSGV